MRMRIHSGPRLLIAVLALVASPALIGVTTLPARDDGPTTLPAGIKPLPAAKVVIDKMITAMGGRAAMEKVTSRVTTGEMEMMGQGMKMGYTTYTGRESQFLNLMEMEGFGTFKQGISGDVSWSLDPFQGARVLEGAEKAIMERSAHLSPLLHVGTDYKSMTTVGREEIAGKKYLKLEMISTDDQSENWFIDEETHLRFLTETVVEAPMIGKVKSKFEESDYRMVGDLLIPHRALIDQGVQKIAITSTKIEHNTEIDPSTFAIPGEVQKLIDKQKERDKAKEPAEEPATGTDG